MIEIIHVKAGLGGSEFLGGTLKTTRNNVQAATMKLNRTILAVFMICAAEAPIEAFLSDNLEG